MNFNEIYNKLKDLISKKKTRELIQLFNLHPIDKKFGNDRVTFVYISVINNDLPVLKFLIDRGADIHLGNFNNIRPIHMAAQENHLTALQLLIAAGADINNTDNKFLIAPMHIAINRGNFEIVAELIKAGADVNLEANVPDFAVARLGDLTCKIPPATKSLRYTPLQYATFVNNIEIVQILLAHGAVLDHSDIEIQNTLLIAISIKNINVEIVRSLIAHGASVNIMYENNIATPLYRAVYNNHLDVIKLLIESGADVNLCKRYRECPLSNAAQLGHLSVVQELIKCGANVNNTDIRKDCSALYYACQNNYLDIVIELIKSGADINHINVEGCSPIAAAFKKGYIPIVNYLIDAGADINILLRSFPQSGLDYSLLGDTNTKIAYLFIQNGFLVTEQNKKKLIERATILPCLCGRPRSYICGGCNIHGYCSKKCQRSDWGAHKSMCQILRNIP
jgi:ankyrin repeat protein